MKLKEKQAQFSHLDVVIDRAIGKKGCGPSGSDERQRKKSRVLKEDERVVGNAFTSWKRGNASYSDDSESLSDYSSDHPCSRRRRKNNRSRSQNSWSRSRRRRSKSRRR